MRPQMTTAQKRLYVDCVKALAAINGFDDSGGGVRACGRLDANETAFFTRQLEAIQTEIVKDEFAELKARTLIPPASGIPEGATSFTWRRYTRLGLAKFISTHGDDLPRVAMYGTEYNTPIRAIGVGYGYSIEEIANAAMAGIPLQSEEAAMAREAYETFFDSVLAHGDTARGIPGLLSSDSVPLTTALAGNWDGATSAAIVDDALAFAWIVYDQSKGRHVPTTMLLGSIAWRIISTKRYSDTYPETCLEVFYKASTMVREVKHWLECDAAAANGTDERAMVYTPDPKNLKYIEGKPFTSYPPQARNLEFFVPAYGKCGGVVIMRPLSAAYSDELGT